MAPARKRPKHRLLIVSNRLPMTATFEDGRVGLELSGGGLVSGLRGPHERSGGLWIGWPGELPRLTPAQRQDLEQQLEELRLVPIHLTRNEVHDYYEQIANGALWPVLHYLIERLPLHPRGWQTYREVNQKFAEAVADHYQPGDLIWVHDYHLMLMPLLLRRLLPDARIGYFLHVPFPAQEVFRVLPWRDDLVCGMLGADLLGFHTEAYAHDFAEAVRIVTGLKESDGGTFSVDGRKVQLGAFPIGADSEAWARMSDDPDVVEQAQAIRDDARGRTIMLGVDRLDYTKGITGRLLALEELFRSDPAVSNRVRFLQVTVPSRERVEAYATLRRRIDELVGRINSAYSTARAVPIHRLHQSFAPPRVAALYKAADVLLATPVRDGMNLVAKEFVASRTDDDGVLILSELAGAAAELPDALIVNPYDVEQLAQAMRRATEMPEAERRRRMRAMRKRVMSYDVHRWADSFMSALAGE